jgi:hypothetical protein
MGGLFGGGGSKNKGSRTTTPTETTSTTPATGVATAASAPIPPESTGPTTLAVDSTSAATGRRRPAFLVTPTMLDDGDSMTGRRETFG